MSSPIVNLGPDTSEPSQGGSLENRLQMIAWAKRITAQQNQFNVQIYNQACKNWADQNILVRASSHPIGPKPEPPIITAVREIIDSGGPWFEIIRVPYDGPLCPDLPPLPVIKAGNIEILPWLDAPAGNTVYRVGPTDTKGSGEKVRVPEDYTGDGVPNGEYERVVWLMGRNSGWYFKIK